MCIVILENKLKKFPIPHNDRTWFVNITLLFAGSELVKSVLMLAPILYNNLSIIFQVVNAILTDLMSSSFL